MSDRVTLRQAFDEHCTPVLRCAIAPQAKLEAFSRFLSAQGYARDKRIEQSVVKTSGRNQTAAAANILGHAVGSSVFVANTGRYIHLVGLTMAENMVQVSGAVAWSMPEGKGLPRLGSIRDGWLQRYESPEYSIGFDGFVREGGAKVEQFFEQSWRCTSRLSAAVRRENAKRVVSGLSSSCFFGVAND